jgi:hypothetical protein
MDATSTIEADILGRLVAPEEPTFSAEAARAILALEFGPSDRQRMHELAGKNQAGTLTAEEEAALDGYVHVGLLLDLLRSKARRSLQEREA